MVTKVKDLHEFVRVLEESGELLRVRAEVDPLLELSEIAARMMKQPCPQGAWGAPAHDRAAGGLGGKALLFENVRGHRMPVLINAYGSYRRLCCAAGCESLEALSARVAKLAQVRMPDGLLGALRKLPELAHLASLRPKVRSGGGAPCQQVVEEGGQADLTRLPVIQCWPDDGLDHPALPHARRYITMGSVLSCHPQSGARNLGIYRVQLHGPRRAAMHIHPPHDGAANWRAWRDLGKPMPAAVVLGGEPAIALAAASPLPPGFDELLLAGFLQGRAIELAACRTIDLAVPASAEIVIEGYVSHQEMVREGPFGDHTGFYSAAGEFPAFHVTAITRRRDAIFPATVVGYPPMEDYYLGKAIERMFLPVLRMLCPEIVDYDLPVFGAFHNFVFVQIRKQYPHQARRVMHALWGAGQLALGKFIVVVDESVDVHDPSAVWFAVGANADPARDIEHASGPLDILDHASPQVGSGGKLGIDATRKLPDECPGRTWPEPLKMSDAVRQQVQRRWKEFGLDLQ